MPNEQVDIETGNFNQCSIKRELSKKRIQKFQHKSTAFERTTLQIMSLKNETLKANKQ